MAVAFLTVTLLRGTSLPPQETYPSEGSLPELCVDVNRASEEELASLPGIGASTARRIVGHRMEAGPYLRIDDLLEVKGIGPLKLAIFAPRVCAPGGRVSGSGE